MRQAGEITYADAHKQRVGEGYVSYTNVQSLHIFSRMHDSTSSTKPCVVCVCVCGVFSHFFTFLIIITIKRYLL